MAINKKISITLLILAAASLLFIFFVIDPIFGQIKTESENLIIQKNKIAESEIKIQNIQDFRANFKQYQPNLEKISQLFINISEPIRFIEFLESEAAVSHLSIEISPPVLRKKDGDYWPALQFSLSLKGSSPDFMKFFERLEASPYLIEPMNLSVRKSSDTEDAILAVLSIKVYAK